MKVFHKSALFVLGLISTSIFVSITRIGEFNQVGKAQISPSKNTLRVALFPYIPDTANDKYSKLVKRIETEFEQKNPSIDLVLKPLTDDDGFYEPDTLKKWLTESPANNGYHLVEIDTLLLGDLVKSNVIQRWNAPLTQHDWHPAARSAVTVNNQIYGVPHWLCSHFIFSRDKSVVEAKSISQLLTALNRLNPKIPNIAGDLRGSWNLPALYLDAWADTYGLNKVASAISPNLDPVVMQSLKAFSKECVTNGKNPCLDETYHDDFDLSAKDFAKGKVDAFFGYSERLNFILAQGASARDIKIASAPFGRGKHPLLFVDAFVLRKDCDQACQKAASSFVAYINAPSTQEWILMSQDAGKKAIPRYLLPATLSVFQTPKVKQDPYYKVLKSEITNALPYPNSGFPAIREQMNNSILKELQ
ncbi:MULTISPECIES: extracellular solute-binding protein [Nostoc]|uniref:ABC transporter substrate-binding protein n=1 Tax=Nostoc paludosum FACHB-159 TaxID=2692908 RepID=A0ABR8KG01_9NOSO|nr:MULTISPECIES: extracellular solute-binding protein [Nostoc]MBD2680598.1 hypothetical protein [Nostoc sp. FACHB-857]MBD2736992.1 hypothetical protein [Nostoc paludosum FACHB-159]